MIPKKCFFTKGVGVHKERLASFELALRSAGLAFCNLVLVSSIYPPGCKRISKEEATTLGIEFDPDTAWDERENLFKMSGKIVRTSNITQSAIGNKDGLWTTVFAACAFVNEDSSGQL